MSTSVKVKSKPLQGLENDKYTILEPIGFSTRIIDGKSYQVRVFPSNIISRTQYVSGTARPVFNRLV